MTQAFNLSQLANKVNTSGQLDVATGVTGTQAVANGGTGQSTYTNGQLLIGNSTGNTLTKSTLTAGSGISITNGAGSITIANTAGGQLQTQLFTAPGTWTNPGSVTSVRVTVTGGGGGGGRNPGLTVAGGSGGGGGIAYANFTIPTSPVTITVGSGGAGAVTPATTGGSGGSSSFGPYISATGGGPGPSGPAGTPGTGTISAPALPGAIRTDGVAAGGRADPGNAPAALVYSYDLAFNAGAGGRGAPQGPQTGDGGVGGSVIVEYIG